MNYDTTAGLFRLMISLPLVILLAYISLRFAGKYMRRMGDGKFIKVLETVPIHSRSAISVVRIGEELRVMGISENGMQTIRLLDEQEKAAFLESTEDKLGSRRRKFRHFFETTSTTSRATPTKTPRPPERIGLCQKIRASLTR